jgi:hypothetical protein
MFADLRHHELQAESAQARIARGPRGAHTAAERLRAGVSHARSALARRIAFMGRNNLMVPTQERRTQPV